MISFRYHIVSIVSVFLALAVGVALGGGPLKGEVDNSLVEQVEADRQEKSDLRAEIASLRTGDRFTDDFATQVAPGLVGGTLGGHAVTLVALPGADEATVTSVTELVGQAGGSVAGTVRLSGGLLDVGNRQLVDELSTQLLDGVPDVSVGDDASTYERVGALLARAVATDEKGGAAVDDAANSIISGLSTADLMSPAADLERRGNLVMFIAGEGADNRADRESASAVMSSLARAVDSATDGVVVAGPPRSARLDGVVQGVRDDVVAAESVSTVDTASRVAGHVVAVLALAEQAEGRAGQYGSVNAADGPLPATAGSS